mgnify:CR=1 FL=1
MEYNTNTPFNNPIEQNGTDYLKQHRIADLFQNLSAALVYNKPGLFFYFFF